MKNVGNIKNLAGGFVASATKYRARPALEVNGHIFTYEELRRIAVIIAEAISRQKKAISPTAAILGHRSITAYAGVLGILLSGKGYVPLSPEFPSERTYKMLISSKSDLLIAGKECSKELEALLIKMKEPLTIILPDTPDTADLKRRYPLHHFVFHDDMPGYRGLPEIPKVDPDSTAYLLFTSGSTGAPKGVAISHKNARAYIDYICRRYDITERDRFSQTFDLTFDLSVHDVFVCWERGACLCVIPEISVMAPAKFIKDKRLTIWFSVPSIAIFMSKLKMLAPGSFETLRYSLFCGEPLIDKLAEQWQAAAPDSIVENLYGPTEATIAIAHYRWDSRKSPEACVNGIVPIGNIFMGQRGCMIDEGCNIVPIGEAGELCLSGTQVSKGYINDPEKTRENYIKIPSLGNETWYRTGDLVKQDKDGCLHYLGRIDNQVKILGHRVELEEIDAVLRNASGSGMSVSVAYAKEEGGPKEIAAFICAKDTGNIPAIINYCRQYLPEYMTPSRIYFIEKMPLNANGKIDRPGLCGILRRMDEVGKY